MALLFLRPPIRTSSTTSFSALLLVSLFLLSTPRASLSALAASASAAAPAASATPDAASNATSLIPPEQALQVVNLKSLGRELAEKRNNLQREIAAAVAPVGPQLHPNSVESMLGAARERTSDLKETVIGIVKDQGSGAPGGGSAGAAGGKGAAVGDKVPVAKLLEHSNALQLVLSNLTSAEAQLANHLRQSEQAEMNKTYESCISSVPILRANKPPTAHITQRV